VAGNPVNSRANCRHLQHRLARPAPSGLGQQLVDGADVKGSYGRKITQSPPEVSRLSAGDIAAILDDLGDLGDLVTALGESDQKQRAADPRTQVTSPAACYERVVEGGHVGRGRAERVRNVGG
jgi:hypothetical protein